jgi:hypothetical protein
MTCGAAKRVGVPVDVSCGDASPYPALCVCWDLHLCSLFTVQLWLLCSRTRPWGHHRRRIRLHSRPLTPSPHPRIVKWCPARWVCASIPLCMLLLIPTPLPCIGFIWQWEWCMIVNVCVLLCSGLGRAASDTVRAIHRQNTLNAELSVEARTDTITLYHWGQDVIFEHCDAVMTSLLDWLYLNSSRIIKYGGCAAEFFCLNTEWCRQYCNDF